MRIVGLAVLCAATLVAPALMLVWMPILLGVPHVASDVKYLVLPLPRRQVVLALVACTLLVALKAVSIASGVSLMRAEMIAVGAWLLGALVIDRSVRWLPIAIVAAGAIIVLPIQFAIIAAFAHNFIALVAWIVVKRPDRHHLAAILGVVSFAVAVAILFGPTVAHETGGDATRWLSLDKAASVMFAGVPLPTARGLLIAFAFLQAVHYAIWLDWIPRGTKRTRVPLLSLFVGATTLVVIGSALVDPAWTRTTYLALASFHIYLELVLLAAWFARKRSA